MGIMRTWSSTGIVGFFRPFGTYGKGTNLRGPASHKPSKWLLTGLYPKCDWGHIRVSHFFFIVRSSIWPSKTREMLGIFCFDKGGRGSNERGNDSL